MKANQKFVNSEEAVSPVIAVILMVAITVVLAATVFVLVNDLGKNVGSSGPSLGMVSDSATSSTSQWTVKLSSATQLADLNDYRFILTTPNHGALVATPDATNSEFQAGYDMYAHWEDTATATAASRTAAAEGADPNDEDDDVAYHFEWLDVDGNGKFSVGDTATVLHNNAAGTAASGYASSFDSGAYTLEVLHIPSGSSAGSLPRTF